MIFQIAALAKLFALALSCLEEHEVWHEETTATLEVVHVAGGDIASLDLHADLWVSPKMSECLAAALEESSL
jgi:hypothetical protein